MRAVLTFHSIDDSGSVLSFAPRSFARLIERMALTNTPILTFENLMQSEHGIAITFDDGMRSVHQHALPVLTEFGVPAHIFLTTGRMGQDVGWASIPQRFDMLDWQQVEDCVRSGLRIECHTTNHPDLRGLSAAAMLEECAMADDEIERRVGQRPRFLAFPFGSYDDIVLRTLAPRYIACFTTRLGYLGRAIDLSRVQRLDSYYLQAPLWNERLFDVHTRAYVALRASVRAVRGRT